MSRTLRFSPDNLQAKLQLAEIHYKRGNYDAARLQLMDLVRKDEPTPEALWLLLRTERRLGDKSAEDSLAMQLRRKFPDSPEYQALLKGHYE